MKTASAPSKAQVAQSQVAFINWLRLNHPNFLSQLEQETNLGDVSSVLSSVSSNFSNLLNNASSLMGQYVANKQQMSLLKMNLQRAKYGQMPLTALPGTEPPMPTGPSMQTWLLIGGGVLLLAFVLSRK